MSNDDFADSLNGIHLICGFSTTSYNYADGGTWAQFLLSTSSQDYPYAVKDAWFSTMDINQPSGVEVRALGETSACGSEEVWGYSTISDPTPDGVYEDWDHTC